MTDRPRLGGAYEIAPDGTLRRVGGTEEPAMPAPAEADGSPIGRAAPPAPPVPPAPARRR